MPDSRKGRGGPGRRRPKRAAWGARRVPRTQRIQGNRRSPAVVKIKPDRARRRRRDQPVSDRVVGKARGTNGDTASAKSVAAPTWRVKVAAPRQAPKATLQPSMVLVEAAWSMRSCRIRANMVQARNSGSDRIAPPLATQVQLAATPKARGPTSGPGVATAQPTRPKPDCRDSRQRRTQPRPGGRDAGERPETSQRQGIARREMIVDRCAGLIDLAVAPALQERDRQNRVARPIEPGRFAEVQTNGGQHQRQTRRDPGKTRTKHELSESVQDREQIRPTSFKWFVQMV
jgi:hypothetical protein